MEAWFLLLLLVLATPCFSLLYLPSSSPSYTCDSILGDSLCSLEETRSNVTVLNETLHYWVYQPTSFRQEEDSLLPVILINGGPGFPHNYLLPMKQLACQGRRVIFYDQVGHSYSFPSKMNVHIFFLHI